MSAALRLFSLLALATCIWGVREDGERYTATSASGDLKIDSDGSRAGIPGTHVCCATFATKKNGKTERMTIGVDVYHESATKDIAKCSMTWVTGVDCADQAACMKECKIKTRDSKRFQTHVQKEVIQRHRDSEKKIQASKAVGQRKYESDVKELELQYEQEVQAAQDKVTKALEAMDAAKQSLQDIQRQYEELKVQFEEAPAKVEAANSEYSKSTEALSSAQAAASENLEKGKSAAAEQNSQTIADADQQMQKLQEKVAARKQRFEELVDDTPVPRTCIGDTKKKGPYASVPCCCSVGGVPMVVDEHFVDWGQCKSAKKYERSTFGKMDIAGLTACSPYQECAKCRALVCGKGMCPV